MPVAYTKPGHGPKPFQQPESIGKRRHASPAPLEREAKDMFFFFFFARLSRGFSFARGGVERARLGRGGWRLRQARQAQLGRGAARARGTLLGGSEQLGATLAQRRVPGEAL